MGGAADWLVDCCGEGELLQNVPPKCNQYSCQWRARLQGLLMHADPRLEHLSSVEIREASSQMHGTEGDAWWNWRNILLVVMSHCCVACAETGLNLTLRVESGGGTGPCALRGPFRCLQSSATVSWPVLPSRRPAFARQLVLAQYRSFLLYARPLALDPCK